MEEKPLRPSSVTLAVRATGAEGATLTDTVVRFRVLTGGNLADDALADVIAQVSVTAIDDDHVSQAPTAGTSPDRP